MEGRSADRIFAESGAFVLEPEGVPIIDELAPADVMNISETLLPLGIGVSDADDPAWTCAARRQYDYRAKQDDKNDSN
jgi:hypothetical protein